MAPRIHRTSCAALRQRLKRLLYADRPNVATQRRGYFPRCAAHHTAVSSLQFFSFLLRYPPSWRSRRAASAGRLIGHVPFVHVTFHGHIPRPQQPTFLRVYDQHLPASAAQAQADLNRRPHANAGGSSGSGDLGPGRVGLRAMSDADRERLIEAHRVVLELESLYDLQYSAMQRMRALIAQRSPARIREMELAAGLTH